MNPNPIQNLINSLKAAGLDVKVVDLDALGAPRVQPNGRMADDRDPPAIVAFKDACWDLTKWDEQDQYDAESSAANFLGYVMSRLGMKVSDVEARLGVEGAKTFARETGLALIDMLKNVHRAGGTSALSEASLGMFKLPDATAAREAVEAQRAGFTAQAAAHLERVEGKAALDKNAAEAQQASRGLKVGDLVEPKPGREGMKLTRGVRYKVTDIGVLDQFGVASVSLIVNGGDPKYKISPINCNRVELVGRL